MPRIPRRSEGSEEAPPEDQRTQLSSGDPLAPPTSAPQTAATSGDPLAPAPSPAPQSSGSSGDPLTQVVPPQSDEPTDLSAAPPVTPASTAAPSEAEVAPGDASSAQASEPTTPAASESTLASESTPSAESTTPVTPDDPTGEQPTVAAPPVAPPPLAAQSGEPPTAVQTSSGDPLATPHQPTAETGDVSAETGEQAPADARPRFRQRTRMRRRLRYLRRLRELAFRDLGGLVFDLHRFGRDRNDLVTAKLEALANIDRELRTLQDGLHDRRDFTDLREAGIAACPRCGTLHDTDANFCPGCGTTLRSAIVRDASPVIVTPAEDADQPPQQTTPAS